MKWLTRLIIYPFVFAFIFVFAILIQNIGQIDPTLFIRPLIVTWLLTATALFVAYKITKDAHRSGWLVALGLTCFLTYNFAVNGFWSFVPTLDEKQVSLLLLAIWFLLYVLLGSRWLWSKLTRPMILTFMLNIVLLVSLLYPVLQLVRFQLRRDGQNREEFSLTFHSESPVQLTADEFPDIYIIILDTYGRSDC